ncbi:MAG: hypothetical protein QF886_00635, partial [Planctomycetota bacterium]|nr:hypothetical protein [Planctomycetota bacterium]
NGYFILGGRRATRAALETRTRRSDSAFFKKAQQLRDEGDQFWSIFNVEEATKTMLAAQQGNEKKMKEIKIAGLPSLAGIFASVR